MAYIRSQNKLCEINGPSRSRSAFYRFFNKDKNKNIRQGQTDGVIYDTLV